MNCVRSSTTVSGAAWWLLPHRRRPSYESSMGPVTTRWSRSLAICPPDSRRSLCSPAEAPRFQFGPERLPVGLVGRAEGLFFRVQLLLHPCDIPLHRPPDRPARPCHAPGHPGVAPTKFQEQRGRARLAQPQFFLRREGRAGDGGNPPRSGAGPLASLCRAASSWPGPGRPATAR